MIKVIRNTHVTIEEGYRRVNSSLPDLTAALKEGREREREIEARQRWYSKKLFLSVWYVCS